MLGPPRHLTAVLVAALSLAACGSSSSARQARQPSSPSTPSATTGTGTEEAPPITPQSAYQMLKPLVGQLSRADTAAHAHPQDPKAWQSVATAARRVHDAALRFFVGNGAVQNAQGRVAQAVDMLAGDAAKVAADLRRRDASAAQSDQKTYDQDVTHQVTPALKAWLSAVRSAGP
jgi:hypothetical protein